MDSDSLLGVSLMLFITGILALIIGTPFVSEFLMFVQFGIGIAFALAGVGLYAVYAIRVLYRSIEFDSVSIDTDRRV